MRAFAAGLVLVLLSGETATAGKLDVAYASMERIIVTTFLTEGGRRYLQGSRNADFVGLATASRRDALRQRARAERENRYRQKQRLPRITYG